MVKALEGVSFDIRKGETIGLVGETGCGKSVTALSVLRLIPSPPGKIEAGEVLFMIPEAERLKLRASEESALALLRANWKSLPLNGNGWSRAFVSATVHTASNPVAQVSVAKLIEIANAVRKATVPRETKEGRRPALPPEVSRPLLDSLKTIYTIRTKYDLLGKDEGYMQRVRGNEISMIFQEPMSALNPVITVGDQIAENILLHQKEALAREALTWIDLERRMMREKPVVPQLDPQTNRILCPVCKASTFGRPTACGTCRIRFLYPSWGVAAKGAEGPECPSCAAQLSPAASVCEVCALPILPPDPKAARTPGQLHPGLRSRASHTIRKLGVPFRRGILSFDRAFLRRLAPAPRAPASKPKSDSTQDKPSSPAPAAPAAKRPPARKDDLVVRVASRVPILRRFRRPIEAAAMRHATEMLHAVRIPDPEKVIEMYPFELSGGMAQRVLIAIALSCNPKLLIADEPTTALDVTIQAQILKLIRDLKTNIGSSVLLITHNLGVVAETCDRVGVMYAGEIVEMASAHDIFKEPLHPYTQGLMESIPSVSAEKERLAMIHGNVPNLITPPPGCRFHPRCPLAKDVCQQQVPEPRMIEPEHLVACHMVGGAADA